MIENKLVCPTDSYFPRCLPTVASEIMDYIKLTFWSHYGQIRRVEDEEETFRLGKFISYTKIYPAPRSLQSVGVITWFLLVREEQWEEDSKIFYHSKLYDGKLATNSPTDKKIVIRLFQHLKLKNAATFYQKNEVYQVDFFLKVGRIPKDHWVTYSLLYSWLRLVSMINHRFRDGAGYYLKPQT